MIDPTEDYRRAKVEEINFEPGSREDLEARYNGVWDTNELQKDFEVSSFMAPYVIVIRKSDGVKGSLEFQHHPRFYFNFKEHK